MTAPIQPTIIRREGVGETVQKGLAPFIQALQFRQNRAQEQQRIDIQRQQVEQQGITQRATARRQASEEMFKLMDAFGPEVLEDPTVVKRLEEQGLNPKALLKGFKTRQAEAEAARAAQQAEFVSSFPSELTEAAQGMVDAFNTIGTSEAATVSFREIASRTVDEEGLAKLLGRFPEFKGLPPDQAIEGIASLIAKQAEVKRGLTPADVSEARVANAEARATLAELRVELTRLQLAARRTGGTPQELVNFAQDVQGIISSRIDNPAALVSAGLQFSSSREEKIRAILGPTFIVMDKKIGQILERAVTQVQPDPR